VSAISGSEANDPSDAWELLSPQLTPSRRDRLLKAAAARTKFIRLVVQDVHQPHNVSACIRSAEAFGIQNIDVVTLKKKFKTSTVSRGVDQWVNLHRFDTIEDCMRNLRDQGFLVAAAFPSGDAIPLDQLPIAKPVALVFGNEHEGLDNKWKELADVRFNIPMAGMVESLNISVCAAISMYSVSQRAKEILGASYFLTPDEQTALLNQWVCRQIASWQLQIARLRSAMV